MNTNISNDIKYIGVNDRDITLFEGQYPIKNGRVKNTNQTIELRYMLPKLRLRRRVLKLRFQDGLKSLKVNFAAKRLIIS